MVAMLNEMDLDRVRAAYDEVRAAPRLVFPPTKRRRVDGRRTEVALPSLGLEPLSVAFSFLHPVELTSSLKRLVRRPGPQRWKLSTLVPRKTEEYGSADYRMAVLLEEGELSFRGNWGLVLEPKEIEKWWLAGYSLQTCPAGSLRNFLQKRYIFVREQCKDYPFPSDCQCRGGMNNGPSSSPTGLCDAAGARNSIWLSTVWICRWCVSQQRSKLIGTRLCGLRSGRRNMAR